MDKPAVLGGPQAIQGVIEPFNTIGEIERKYIGAALHGKILSGFLGGRPDGGRFVQLLEGDWKKAFKVPYAVSVNSATSGLLAACMACNIKPWHEVIVSAYTMSATAAAPSLLGAKIVYADVESETFCLDIDDVKRKIMPNTGAVIVTNLFGHPARLNELAELCNAERIALIEDNAQAPFATEGARFAGTIGDVGVFSLNVHKHLQCGEGGVCVTHNPALAIRLQEARNHGEMSGGGVGLNLRMTEITAAIAIAQLSRAKEIIDERIRIAHLITKMVDGIKGITVPKPRDNCTHVYYLWPFLVDEDELGLTRREFVTAIQAEGFPVGTGYVRPLYRLATPALTDYNTNCPVVEELYGKTLCYYENCGYSPTDEQIEQIGDAFRKVSANAEPIRERLRRSS